MARMNKMAGMGKILILLFLLSLTTSLVSADRGMIPISDVSVYGPGQKAIVAWNGEEEILILSTDVYASRDSLVLEILPLPSNPKKIEKGDFKSFAQIQGLIQKHAPQQEKRLGPGIEVVFHEKIGAHDITVVKVSDVPEFIKWAENFLRDKEIEYKIASPKLERLVDKYIEDGINFFVFDLIEITTNHRSIDPILYQFKSTFLYYPLEISSLASGYTRISLFALTKDAIDTSNLPSGMRLYYYGKQPIQFQLNKQELQLIDPKIAELLGDYAWLTALKYEGQLDELKDDLKIGETLVVIDTEILPVDLPMNVSIKVDPKEAKPVKVNKIPAMISGEKGLEPISAISVRIKSISGERTVIIEKGKNSEIVINATVPATTTEVIKIKKSQLYLETSKGAKVVRIMPDDVLKTKLKPQTVYNIELKAIDEEPVYEAKGVAKVKLLWFIPLEMKIKTIIDADSGEILSEDKPWWGKFIPFHYREHAVSYSHSDYESR